ncbi:MAG: hypothetical protein PHN82_04840 [bacterium]|nr:hypothetical protein [bacterium]
MPRPSAGSRTGDRTWGPAAGGAAAEFLQGRGAEGRPAAGRIEGRPRPAEARADRIESRPDRRGDISARRPDRIENRQKLQGDRVERRDEIRDQVRDNYPRLDFWSDHPNWASWRVTHPYGWATWPMMVGWVGYGWREPVYYSYGENVYYQDNSVYYGDQVIASADEYAEQAEQIAGSAPEVAPDTVEWMPLGVFALTQDGQPSGPEPSQFLQLDISREGIIGGMIHDASTGDTRTIEGMADKASQRAAWTVSGTTRPVMECGVGNLTGDTVPVLLHFADGQTQQRLLVRLEEPPAR